MEIGPGITIGRGVNFGFVSVAATIPSDSNLAFNSVNFLNQFKFSSPYTNTVTFNADGSISSSPNAGDLTRWYTGTPANASQFEIAVQITFQSLLGSPAGTFTINGVSQVDGVKSSYYPLTSGITIGQTFSSVNPGDEWYNEYTIYIRKTGANEINRIGNQTDIVI